MMLLWLPFIVNFCRRSFCDFRTKRSQTKKTYLNMFQTNLRDVCLSVTLEFYLTFVLAPAYTSFCKGLKYSLKVRYIILAPPNVAGFLIFESVLLGNAVICLKKYHKNERHLRLVTHSFTKLSQNVCLIDTHILIYRYARCNCNLWKVL